VKDFSFFRDRMRSGNMRAEILTQHLFNLNGDEWKALRTKLTPTFTSGKLKIMFTLFQGCADQLNGVLKAMVEKETLIDIKDTMANFTMDIIGTCAFGLEIKAMDSNDNRFKKIGSKIFPTHLDFMVRLKILVNLLCPQLSTYYKFRFIEQEVEDFLVKVVHDTVSYRENNNVTRNDFLDLLIQLRNKEKEGSNFGTYFITFLKFDSYSC
jgi:cytochrome P450 family 6